MGMQGHMQRTMLPSIPLMVILLAVGRASSQGMDVCPANSPTKALPFLKAAKPDAIAAVLGTGSSFTISMSAVTEFIKTTLVPMIGANVFFFALAALFLLIFVLWRFLRFCCYIICCRGSCDAKREKNNIYQLLFSKRMKILKGFMFLFGLIAIIFAIYGMASVSKQKDMVGPAFGVIDTLSTYFVTVSGEVDNLVATISNVTGIIDDFQAIITVDIDVDNLTATLTAIGTFLDSAPNPPGVLTSINNLKTRFDTFKSATGALQKYVDGTATFNTELINLNTDLNTLISAYTDLTDMQTECDAVKTQLIAIDWSVPAPGPGGSALNNLASALTAMVTTSWITTLTTLSAAIDSVAAKQTPTTDPFGKLWTLADLVQQEVTGMSTDIDNLITAINGLMTKNTAIMPTLDFLTNKLVYINTTVLQLTSGMQSAYNSLQTANTSAAAVFAGSPSPAGQAVTDLGTLKTQLPSTAAITNVKSLLNTPRTTLETSSSAPFSVNGPIYKNWISILQSSFNDAAVSAFKTAVSDYKTGTGSWNTLCSTQSGNTYTPFNTLMTGSSGVTSSSQLGSTMLSDPTQLVQTFKSSANTINTQGNDATLGSAITAASTAATSAKSASPVTMTLPGVATQLTAVKTIYNGFGSPYSTVVNGPKSELASIKSSAITAGNSAKQQIVQGVAGVNSTVGNMQSMLVGQLSNVKTDYEPMAHQYDGYRYSASMALYGVSVLFVGLVLMSGYLNYHFGANISVLGLLVITVLYFLLAVLIALLISVLYLGCGDLEPIILQFAPSLAPTLTPILKYYFLNEGTDLKAVLKAANLVDIDAMIQQIQDSQGDILTGLAGSFTFEAAPLAVLARINGTITGVEAGVNSLLTTLGRDGLLPVYGEVKGLVCCTVPDMMSSMWIGLTFAGVFAFALIFCTFFFIGKLDKTPRKDCCGCTCHTQGKYAGTVFPDTLPQFQTPGFDNPLGPYDAPPPNGAGWNGNGEAMVVVNAGGAQKGKGQYS